MDDPGERGVVGRGRDLELQGAGLIDGAGEDQVADRLVDWNALSRHWCLIHRAAARRHPTVQWNARAWLDPRHRPRHDLHSRHLVPLPIGLSNFGGIRRQCQQALDRIAGSIHGARLDQFGNGVQGHDHRRLWPLPDQECAGHSHAHQRVHVQLPTSQGRQTLAIGGEPGKPDGNSG